MSISKIAEGVWVAERDGGPVRITRHEMIDIAEDAVNTNKLRSRILLHAQEDPVHYMLIASCKGSFNPMHSHEKKESMFIISGDMLIRFKDRPDLLLTRGDFLMLPGGTEHQPLPLSDCIILEIAEK